MMSGPDLALGGYDPEAGLAPELAARRRMIPVPSLLRSLLSEHLDPGYAAAAARTAAGKTAPRWHRWLWRALAALLVAAVFAAAASQARSLAPGLSVTQKTLAAGVAAAERSTDALTLSRADLSARVGELAATRLRDDAQGRALLDRLDVLTLAGAGVAMTGPGLTVDVTDPGIAKDLTDVSVQRIPGSQQVILDRDLQLVVNSLWSSGAEAVAVGGVRIGPNVTIRQAGGAILVDTHPIGSPYAIVAIGPPNSMRENFERSPGLQRLRLLETSYGVGVSVSTGDDLTVPAGPTRDLTFAKPSKP